MTSTVRAVLLVIAVLTAPAMAQDPSTREFLLPIDRQTRSELVDRHALEIRTLEFFAKPGKLDIYAYDIGALETQGDLITITPFGAPAIELVSHGVWRDPRREGKSANWRGTLPVPPSHGAYRARLRMLVQSVGSAGQLRFPDPNRDPTKSILANGGRIDPEESYQLGGEKLFYRFTGNQILNPETESYIRFFSLGDDLEFVLVYEVDEEKVLNPWDDSPVSPIPPSREQVRRRIAYEAHVENVRRELGLSSEQE